MEEIAIHIKDEENKIKIEEHNAEALIVKEIKTRTEEISRMPNVSNNPLGKPVGKTKESAWNNIVIKKQISLEFKKPKLSVEEIEDATEPTTHETETKNIMEWVMFEYFYLKITTIIKTNIEVTNKVFKKKIGFGFISETNRHLKSRILRIDKSLFYDGKVYDRQLVLFIHCLIIGNYSDWVFWLQ